MTPQAMIEAAAVTFFDAPRYPFTEAVKRMAEPVVARMMAGDAPKKKTAPPPAPGKFEPIKVVLKPGELPYTKLPARILREMADRGTLGTAQQIAEHYGVSPARVGQIAASIGVTLPKPQVARAETARERLARERYEACKAMALRGDVIRCSTIAEDMGVSICTVQHIFQRLEREGFEITRWTKAVDPSLMERRNALRKVAARPSFSTADFAARYGVTIAVINSDLRAIGMPRGRSRK